MHNILQTDVEEIITRLGEVAEDFAGKSVLIAGGRGFLGRYFMAIFETLNRTHPNDPCRVTILDNLITAGELGQDFPDSPHFQVIEHDVAKPLEMDHPFDFVIHAAGIASPFYYRAYPLETLDVAVLGNRHLLKLAERNRARYTFFSSSEIYGDPDPGHIPTPESYRGNVSAQGPRACYDESKRLGETICYIFHNHNGVHTNIIRPFNVYGPGMQETDYRVLPNFASRIKGGRPLQIYGTGNQTRTFCYVSDAMNGFIRTIARGVPGETYNIGNPEPEVSMLTLAEKIGQVLNRPIEFNRIEYPDSYPADEPNRRCPDIKKAQLQLHYQPAVSLDDGLQRFLGWADQLYTGKL